MSGTDSGDKDGVYEGTLYLFVDDNRDLYFELTDGQLNKVRSLTTSVPTNQDGGYLTRYRTLYRTQCCNV